MWAGLCPFLYRDVTLLLSGLDNIPEDVACSENGNHATIFATGGTADEVNAKFIGALRELRLIPVVSSTEDELNKVRRKEDPGDPSGAS